MSLKFLMLTKSTPCPLEFECGVVYEERGVVAWKSSFQGRNSCASCTKRARFIDMVGLIQVRVGGSSKEEKRINLWGFYC